MPYYRNIPMMQESGVTDAFWEGLFGRFYPRSVLELGTGSGAFTLFIADWCYTCGARLMTIDKVKTVVDWDYLCPCEIEVVVADQFECEKQIRNHLWDGPRLVLCDGFKKKQQLEFVDGLKLLEAGDCLMAHDVECPENGGLTWDDVTNFLHRGYVQANESAFKPVGWLCLFKEQ